MGVRGLQTFMEKYVKNGFVEVSIIDKIEQYKSDKHQDPILLIDLCSFFNVMFQNKEDTVYGGRWKKYSETLDALFTTLRAAGAVLVFFEDGLIEIEKYPRWIQRRNQCYDDHIKIIDHVNSGSSVDEIYKTFKDTLDAFSTAFGIIEGKARQYGTLIYSVTKDCDVEMVRYANQNNVLAILTDDTDFLIFKGNFLLWSARRFDVKTLKIIELSRSALRSTLELSDDQLAILSTLAGNDYINYDEIQYAIGKYFRFKKELKFPNIAKYIRQSKLANQPVGKQAEVIGLKMFSETNAETLERIEKSLTAYNFDFEDATHSPLLQLCLDKHANATFKVLSRFPKNFTLVFFDLRRTDMPSYHDMAVPIYQRHLGVLFFDQQNVEQGQSFEIYSRQCHVGSFKKMLVEPIYPSAMEVPSMMELLDPQHTELDDDRFILLKFIINEKILKDADLQAVPQCFFLDVLTLTAMKAVGAVSADEADVFLFTVMKVKRNEVPEDIEYPPTVDGRAFILAFAFGKFREVVSNILETLGLFKLQTISQFDGVLFHKSYLQFKEEGKMFEEEVEDLAEFRYYK